MSTPACVERFRKQHARGDFPGGQLVVRHRGQVVVDEAIGLASGWRDGEPRVEVTSATRFGVFSASKPVVAMAVALLDQRGLLDVDAPLARYVPGWPADRTVLDVLTHRAGLLVPELVADERRWGDHDGIVAAIAAARPRYPRGTLAYGPYEFGWILAEVVARVAGEPLPAFVERELLGPAGVGARFTTREPGVARTYWLGGRRTVAGTELSARWEQIHNHPDTLATLVPGAGLIATAGDLAGFYQLLLDGGRDLLRPDTIAAYTAVQASGFDRSNRLPLRVGRGFLLGRTMPSPYGRFATSRCYGHPGAFSTVAWADPDHQIAAAYVTNANRGPYELLRRAAAIGSSARRWFR